MRAIFPSGAGAGSGRRSPRTLSLISDLFMLLAIAGFVRSGRALFEWNLQVELLGRPLAVYLVISGLVWALVGLLACWLILRRSQAAIPAIWVGAVFFPLAFWLERFLLVRAPEDWVNWPFMLGLSVIWLALAGFTVVRKATRAYLSGEDRSE